MVLRREVIDWDDRTGWHPELGRVRQALPDGVQDMTPWPTRGRGLWAVTARAGDVPVGIAWSVNWPAAESHALIEEVAVHLVWQRQSIGSDLVIETARWMHELGFTHVAAYPISGSGWLERLGFVPDGYRNFIADAGSIGALERTHG